MAKTQKKPEPTQDDKLQDIGRRAFESIAEMVAKLDAEDSEGESDDDAREKAREEILEDPLSLQVRGGWHTPGEETGAEEFELLLGTGGPAVRIRGELNQHCEPSSARLETQDWGTPWTEYRGAWGGNGAAILLTYCQQFSFGEG